MRHIPLRTDGISKICWLAFSFLLVITISGDGFAKAKVVKAGAIPVSVDQFALEQEGEDFFLQPLPLTREHPRINST